MDSWRSDNEYWVYYELNKDDYAALVEARRQKAIRNGFDFGIRDTLLYNREI